MQKLDAAKVTEWIQSYVSDFLDIPATEITPDSRFDELGLDSADSVIICGAFEEQFNVEMEATLFLRNANLAELIADLRASGYVA